MTRLRTNPYSLVLIGLLATGYGIHLIKRGIEGDTLLPGSLFNYVSALGFHSRWTIVAVTASSRDLVSFYNPEGETRLNKGTADYAD